jgi:DNA-binding transcriptional regulator YdaS (Cro superfamily)
VDLRTYLERAPKGERRRLADAIGTEVEYIYQLSGGHRTPSLDLAKKIEQATAGQVTVHDWPVPKPNSEVAA